ATPWSGSSVHTPGSVAAGGTGLTGRPVTAIRLAPPVSDRPAALRHVRRGMMRGLWPPSITSQIF
ncbi:MAG: hypothetical protein WD072_12295, partial [Pirellulales bacterium]